VPRLVVWCAKLAHAPRPCNASGSSSRSRSMYQQMLADAR
jgi:hypothetical protein